MEIIDFQGSKWVVKSKVDGSRIDDPSTLKGSYGCDLVIRDSRNLFYMLNEIIDVEFEEM